MMPGLSIAWMTKCIGHSSGFGGAARGRPQRHSGTARRGGPRNDGREWMVLYWGECRSANDPHAGRFRMIRRLAFASVMALAAVPALTQQKVGAPPEAMNMRLV